METINQGEPLPASVETIKSVDTPSLLESSLPDSYHAAFKMKLAGVPVSEIAAKLGIDRTTVWRHCREVEREFAAALESSPQFNMLALEVKRLCDLEEINRTEAAKAKSERSRAMLLNNALKCCQVRQQLLLDTGIFDRVASKMFQAIVNLKPVDPKELESKQSNRTREEIVAELITRLGNSSQL